MDQMDYETDLMSFEPLPVLDMFEDLPVEQPQPISNEASVTRTQGPTRGQWEAIRPVFMQLYLEEGKKLEEIMKELADTYGFYASMPMYKRRIGKWEAYKNYKASEKEAILKSSNRRLASGFAEPQECLRGRPIKYDRIQRYCRLRERSRRNGNHRQQRILQEVRPDSAMPASGLAITDSGYLNTSATEDREQMAPEYPGKRSMPSSGISCLLSRISDPDNEFQRFLWNINAYFTWYLNSEERRNISRNKRSVIHLWRDSYRSMQPDTDDFFVMFKIGSECLRVGDTHFAWRYFDRGCQMIKDLIRRPKLRLLGLLLRLAAWEGWDGLPGLRKHVLAFALGIATVQHTLGPQHPLISILQHCSRSRISNGERKAASRLVIDRVVGLSLVYYAIISQRDMEEVAELWYNRSSVS